MDKVKIVLRKRHIIIMDLKASGVYKIVGPGGVVYIGSAKNFKKRWKEHVRLLNKNVHHSRYLQRHWNKYGEYAFTFSVIEYVSNADELVSREQFWLDLIFSELKKHEIYNTLRNARSVLGYKHTLESRLKMSQKTFHHTDNAKAKIGAASKSRGISPETAKAIKDAKIKNFGSYFEFKSPEGIIHKITDLKSFANANGLHTGGLYQLRNRTKLQYRGWTLPDTILEKIVHRLLSPSGEIFEFTNISQFCREHGLCKVPLGNLLKKKPYHKQHKGWKLYEPCDQF